MTGIFKTNSFRILVLFFLVIIVNTVFTITLIYENQVDIISENAKLKAEKMVSSAVVLLDNSLARDGRGKISYEKALPEIQKSVSPVIKEFVIFSDEGRVLYKTTGDYPVPKNYILDGMKALTNSAFAGGNYYVNTDDENLAINFYIPLKKVGEGNLLFYTRHNVGQLNDRMKSLYRQASLLIVVALVLNASFALYFYFSHIRPIFILESESRKITRGDFTGRIEIRQENEFGSLARAFNLMADSIQERIKGHKEQKEIAEASSHAKSEFLAQMSHEIRTPLNSIHGFIELLKKTEIDAKQEEFLNVIRLSADDLLGIINDILDFSKIESRRLELDETEFHPLTEFESIISLMSLKAVEKNMLVIAYIDPSLAETCIGDPLRIKQVLTNLLSNALKFTPEEGTIILEITKEWERDNSCRIAFSVSDNGIGISEAKQEKIFSSFFQEDSSITRKYGGTGLGLAISQNLVRLMGGKLELDSRKGQGSRFFFSLNFNVAEDIEFSEGNLDVKGIQMALVSGENSLKPVEDNILLYLKAMGIQPRLCNTFEELRGFHETSLVVIIYHEHLLENSNLYFNEFPDMPVIYLCQRQEFELSDRITSRFSNILYLPVTPGRLRQSVQTVLNRETGLSEGGSGRDEVKMKPVYRGSILLAEDNKVNQMLMKLLLDEFGASVDIASNGMTAFDMFTEKKYDLVFMDIHMPVSDGIEATQMIREHEKKEGLVSVPVVALTARAIKGDRELFLDSGMDGYLSKPVNLEKLEMVLDKYFEKEMIEKEEPVAMKPTAGTGLIKLDKISERLQLPEDVIINIMKNFFLSSPDDIERLKEGVSENDHEKIYQASHKIKGSTANLEFDEIFATALEIEELAHEKKEADYGRLLEKLLEIYDRAKSEFEGLNIQ